MVIEHFLGQGISRALKQVWREEAVNLFFTQQWKIPVEGTRNRYCHETGPSLGHFFRVDGLPLAVTPPRSTFPKSLRAPARHAKT